MDIPDIVKKHVLKTQGRMPETQQEINDYLDLINHSKAYAEAFEMEQHLNKRWMKKLGFKTTEEIRKEGIR